MLLLASHTEPPEFPLPERATQDWQEDAAYQAVTSPDFKSRFSQLYDVEIWLPCRFSFKFKAGKICTPKCGLGHRRSFSTSCDVSMTRHCS